MPIGIVLLNWAKAEPDRIAKEFIPVIAGYASKAASGAPLTYDDVRWALVGIIGTRGPYFAHFLLNVTRWQVASCPAQEIGALYLNRYFEHYPDLPEHPDLRNIAELAEGDPKNRLDEPFDLAKMQGKPMLVSYSAAGPWCVLEGTHRLVAIQRLVAAGTPPIESLEVIVGICEQATDWHMWRPNPGSSTLAL